MSKPASQEISARIRKMVITGELAPGSALTEVGLAESLKCGRTPLREALQHLSHSYLIIIAPRQGILIPTLDIVDFQQAHEAMLATGAVCAELAAVRGNRGQLEEMREIVSEQERTASPYGLSDLDYRFHTKVAEATSNRYLADSSHSLHASVARFIYAGFAASLSRDFSIAEHRQIVEAIASGDRVLAAKKWRDHIVNGRDRLLSVLGIGSIGRAL
jgi:DNA-binding GntR family transcriptional regulator